jgi:serine/threonine-protein kinase RsbW
LRRVTVCDGRRSDVAAFLARDGLPRTMVEDATIALAEALNNIEEHAYSGRPDQPVLVDIRRAEALVRCRIEDRGTPLPGGSLPGGSMPAPDPAAHDEWPEGGFGWGLLHRSQAI